ncbi:BTB/POZ and MATH domain-containing protein 2-like [Triticum dicoccoides]|uniref:BTB/POZ and MATH domain-containing protein 2-like n=1 Tax=Triticum dicoccoides TaxID=85692 RepID=UPI001891CCAF|nr:BTB/POZ and MATH domain-containing protein 2-like [Triticum dicoccoides]
MSSFTGVSVVEDHVGSYCRTSAVEAGTDSGYHLLMVNGYSRTKEEKPTGRSISSGAFVVGGYAWLLEYYPNGKHPNCADFISLFLSLVHDDSKVDSKVDATFSFCLVDQVEKQMPMYIHATNKATRFESAGDYSWGISEFLRRDALERSANLKGDSFTIRCDIMVCEDSNTEDPGGHDTKVLVSDLDQHFNILLQTKVGADVTFEVSGETFTAHRCVLAARSKVFMAQLFGPMKEGTSTSGVIHIKDMGANVFRALLRFIYTDSCPEIDNDYMEEEQEMSQGLEEGQEDETIKDDMWLQRLQDLFVAADRYDLQRLKCICEMQLSDNIGASSVMSTLALAEQHHCQGLKEACLKFIQVQSSSCMQTVTTTDGWDHVVSTYPSVLKELFVKLASKQQK